MAASKAGKYKKPVIISQALHKMICIPYRDMLCKEVHMRHFMYFRENTENRDIDDLIYGDEKEVGPSTR